MNVKGWETTMQILYTDNDYGSNKDTWFTSINFSCYT